MTTKPWKTWFTADTHFGHGNIILYCKRPFMDPADMEKWRSYPRGAEVSSQLKERIETATHLMNETMVQRWNETVGPEDHVWHLGDFHLSKKTAAGDFLLRLNGKPHLIRGNHDKDRSWAHPLWVFSQNYAELRVDKTDLVLFHYAMRVWNGSFGEKAIQLFGHSHGMLEPFYGQCDVGVDCWDFRPVSLDQIKQRIGWQDKP